MAGNYFHRQDIDLTDFKPMILIPLENNNRLCISVYTTSHYGYLTFNKVGDEVHYKEIKLYHTWDDSFCTENIKLNEEYRFPVKRGTHEFFCSLMVLEVKYSLRLTNAKEQEVQTEEVPTYEINTSQQQSLGVDPDHSFDIYTNMMKILNNAFEAEEFYDVTFLTTDSLKVYGHRCILIKQSEVFASLFKEHKGIEDEIKVNFSFNIVSQAIKFCYGKVDAINGHEMDLIQFAETYKVHELRKACIQFLANIDLTVENICQVTKISFDENLKDVKTRCVQFLKENKNSIEKQMFDNLPHEVLVEIIVTI